MGEHTEVEVVLQAVSHEQDATNGVGKGYGKGTISKRHTPSS